MRRVTLSAIYSINKVKFLRLIKNLSARQLSVDIGKSPEYVSNVENNLKKTQYPHDVLLAIAGVFGCDVRELYPLDEDLFEDDGSRFVKEIISLSNIDDALLVLNGMIDAECFKDGMSFEETSIHLHEQGTANSLVIKKALEALEKANKLSFRNDKYFCK